MKRELRIVSIALMLVWCFGAGCTQPPAEKPPRWEYNLVTDPLTEKALEKVQAGEAYTDVELAQDFLNEAGDDGWELVSIEEAENLRRLFYWQKKKPPSANLQAYEEYIYQNPVVAPTPPVAIDPAVLEAERKKQTQIKEADSKPSKHSTVDELLTEIDSVKLTYPDEISLPPQSGTSKVWIFKRRTRE